MVSGEEDEGHATTRGAAAPPSLGSQGSTSGPERSGPCSPGCAPTPAVPPLLGRADPTRPLYRVRMEDPRCHRGRDPSPRPHSADGPSTSQHHPAHSCSFLTGSQQSHRRPREGWDPQPLPPAGCLGPLRENALQADVRKEDRHQEEEGTGARCPLPLRHSPGRQCPESQACRALHPQPGSRPRTPRRPLTAENRQVHSPAGTQARRGEVPSPPSSVN